MKTFEVKATLRKELGKKETKALRAKKIVPCVLYGGKETIHFAAEATEFRHLIYTPHVYLVKLNIEGTIYDAIMQDIQFDPVTDVAIHMDFYQLEKDKKVTISIPVNLHGFSVGVKAGGKLHQLKRKLKVKGFINDLPDIFNISIENLELGKSIKVGELSFPNIELLDPKSSVVASVKLTRIAKDTVAGEGAEKAEGEGEEGAEKAEE